MMTTVIVFPPLTVKAIGLTSMLHPSVQCQKALHAYLLCIVIDSFILSDHIIEYYVQAWSYIMLGICAIKIQHCKCYNTKLTLFQLANLQEHIYTLEESMET